MPSRRGSPSEENAQQGKHYERGTDYRKTMDRMAAMGIVPPTDANDNHGVGQLMARILQDGERGYQQTLKEYQAIMRKKKHDLEQVMSYGSALSCARICRDVAEKNGDPSSWRHKLNEFIIDLFGLDES